MMDSEAKAGQEKRNFDQVAYAMRALTLHPNRFLQEQS